ncbi:hypothetical protein KPH14_010868 [Odynerus spinipes]|uniref:Copper transport protein n=1 Tax=Odynerus spinipes TaxID=1348599 RepID=A0AAD9VMW9_9HYME|nr:hypothetical protein KPH14_010868 [Odynerus spinipes]
MIVILLNSKYYYNIITHLPYKTLQVAKMHMWYWFGENLGLIALAILYEAMKVLQIKLQTIIVFPSRSISRSSENSSLLSKMTPRSFVASPAIDCPSCCKWTLQVLHWSLHTTLGYILMMAVMTYNVYINIALVIGSCLGYWIFGPVLIELYMNRFQEKQKIIKCDKDCADAILNQERRESAVSVVAEQLVLEATAEIHAPRDV